MTRERGRGYRDSRVRAGGGVFCGAGVTLDPIGDSRVVDLHAVPTWRKLLSARLPLLAQNGATTDADGLKHDGTSGANTGTAAITTACAASAALAPTPTHALLWLGVNDEGAAVAPATTRSNLLARVATLIGGANAPKVIVVREPRVRTHLPQIGSTTDGRTRGIAAWQRNELAAAQVALGLGARVAVADPTWVYPTDYWLGYDIHQSDSGAVHLVSTLVPILASFPGCAAATPRASQQATLSAALGADLLHGFDGRDTPTEAAGLMSQWAAFVGGVTADQATASRQPVWTGGAWEGVGAGADGKFAVLSAAMLPATFTLTLACQLFDSVPAGTWHTQTLATIDGTGNTLHVNVVQNDDVIALEFFSAARRTRMEWALVNDFLPHVFTFTYDDASQAATSSYTCRADGVSLGAPTLVTNAAGDYSGTVATRLGSTWNGGATYGHWNGTIDALLVANYGLSATKRDALEVFATSVIS